MSIAHDWLIKKVELDISNFSANKKVYVIVNEERIYSDYHMDIEKVPDPYVQRKYNLTVRKYTLSELQRELENSNCA